MYLKVGFNWTIIPDTGDGTRYLAEGFKGSSTEFGTIATAFYGGLWSFDGW